MIHEGQIALMIPIIIFLIPIIAILTKHQRDMAQLYHQNHQNNNTAEVEALRRELQELRQLVAQQTLALDDVRQATRQISASVLSQPTESLGQRLSGQ